MKRALSLTIFLLLALTVGCAQEQPPLIPRKVLFGNPVKGSPTISPDGKKLAYLAPNGLGVLNVWVKNLADDVSDGAPVTKDPRRGIRNYFWQGDSEHILYLQDLDGDENWQLNQVSILTGQDRNLTPFPNVQANVVAASREHPNKILVGLNKRDPTLFDVYSLNLATGELEMVQINDHNASDWLADYDLNVRASSTITNDGGGVVHVKKKGKKDWEELLRWGPDESDNSPSLMSFTADGEAINLLNGKESTTRRLVQINLTTGKETVLAEDPNYDISGVTINPLSKEIEAARVVREKQDWIPLNAKAKENFEKVTQGHNTPFFISSRDNANRFWIIGFLSDIQSVRYYLYDTEAKKKTFLFAVEPELDRHPLAKMQPVTYQARDGMEIHAYLTLPPGKDPHNLPAVVLVHGGPWVREQWGYNPMAQWLANRGYAVLQPNYRGSTGYGRDYLNAGNKEWAGKMHTDLIDGKKWLVTHGYANPDRVAIMGGSYGGYATLGGLTFSPEEFCCGVDIVGPSNLITLIESIPPYWEPLKAVFSFRLGDIKTEREFLIESSPLFKADQITKPLLIGQGANDPRVKQAESDQIAQAIRDNGGEVTYILFEDEGHGFARPENRMIFYAAVESFLGQYLGGRIESATEEEDWTPFLR